MNILSYKDLTQGEAENITPWCTYEFVIVISIRTLLYFQSFLGNLLVVLTMLIYDINSICNIAA